MRASGMRDARQGGTVAAGCSAEQGPWCRRGRGRLCGDAKPVSSWILWEVYQPPDHLAPARGAAGAAVRGPGLPAPAQGEGPAEAPAAASSPFPAV